MALFAALTLVGIQQGQVPFADVINLIPGVEVHGFGWTVPALLAIVLTGLVMIGMALIIEALILKHLVNQPPIILFMATIGLAYFLEGLGDTMWGADIKTMDVGLPQGMSGTIDTVTNAWFGYGFYVDQLNIVATVVAAVLVALLMLFSQYSKQGRALRAVADDHQAALSVGISLRFIWVLVWSIAGFVALVAGIMWGARSGVQFSLSLIALKALPVLMLGGGGGLCDFPGQLAGVAAAAGVCRDRGRAGLCPCRAARRAAAGGADRAVADGRRRDGRGAGKHRGHARAVAREGDRGASAQRSGLQTDHPV